MASERRQICHERRDPACEIHTLEQLQGRIAEFALFYITLSTRHSISAIQSSSLKTLQLKRTCNGQHYITEAMASTRTDNVLATDSTTEALASPQTTNVLATDSTTEAMASPQPTSVLATDSTTEAMAFPQTTTRTILKPKSIAQRLKTNQSTTAPLPAAPLVAEPPSTDQTATSTDEEEARLEGIKLIHFIVSTLNEQTTAYIELKADITTTSEDSKLTELQGVSKVVKTLYSELKMAITDYLAAQSGIFLILSLPPSELTIHNLRRVAAGLRGVLHLANGNIELVRGYVMNVEVLGELQCELEKLKHQCLFGYAENYMKMLGALERENGEVKKEEEERQGLVGPRRADFVSLFPSRRGMARLFCGEEEE